MAGVFVRGFDFGTTEAQIKKYCSKAGPVKSVEMFGRGSAVVTYASEEKAQKATEILDHTTMPGNTRYIEVKVNDDTKGKRKAGEGGCTVFVRGFDFGTTDEQFEAHVGQAGTVEKVQWCTKGSARVTYASEEEAQNAIDTLQGTTIDGNTRFIDVLMKDDEERPPAKKAKGGGKGMWVQMPMGMQALPWDLPMMMKGMGKGKSKGTGGKIRAPDPPGSGRVFVRGFDFGTTDEQLEAHMSSVGQIVQVHWANKGSAVVVYKRKAMATKAVNELNGTVLDGNSRYIDVILKESE
jgi:RNA recognition motif-containing protein